MSNNYNKTKKTIFSYFIFIFIFFLNKICKLKNDKQIFTIKIQILTFIEQTTKTIDDHIKLVLKNQIKKKQHFC